MEPSKSKNTLQVITYKDFRKFVNETGYVTDAEKYGWSFLQLDVFNFIKVKNANL
jgi:formylglycine-generating enzyme required for sulfatase activity